VEAEAEGEREAEVEAEGEAGGVPLTGRRQIVGKRACDVPVTQRHGNYISGKS